MKKIILASTLATSLLAGMVHTASASNTITFTGKVRPTLCTLSINSRGLEADVIFEDVQKKDVVAGTLASPVPVNITVGNCPAAAVGSTRITFSGAKSSTTDAFAVDPDDLDTALVIEMKDSDGNPIVPNEPNDLTIIANTANQFVYTASMRALNENVPVGHFDAITTVAVDYD